MPMTVDKRHQFDREEFYGDFAIALGYRQNFDRYRLSTYFFNKNGKLSIGANDTTGVDVRASDLGLSTTFSGCASLCPKYSDFVADFDLYTAWDEFVQGLWTELRVPLIYSRWNSNICSTTSSAGGDYYALADGTTSYVVSTDEDKVAVAYTNAASALVGCSTFGDAPALHAGKFTGSCCGSSCCTNSATGLGGIRLSLGYDFLRREKGYLGLALDVAFPAWNKPCKCNNCCDLYMFEPKVGSQHMWKIGGVLSGKYLLWDRNEDRRLDFVFDGRVYGAFGGSTTRLLGLNLGGCRYFNHYLLLKKYTISGDEATYAGLERAANLLKKQVKSKALVEAEVTAMLNYRHGGFVAALGYNFFGRGAECLCQCCCSSSCGSCCGSSCNSSCGSTCGTSCSSCSTCDSSTYYVIKGDLPVYDGDVDHDGGFYTKAGSNVRTLGDAITGDDVDATHVQDNAINFGTSSCSTGCSTGCSGDVDLCSAAHPTYISNTIFLNLGYNWEDVDWKPYLGVIGDIELGSNNTALRLWGIFVKGGICF